MSIEIKIVPRTDVHLQTILDARRRAPTKRVRHYNVMVNGKPAVMALASDSPLQSKIDELAARAALSPFRVEYVNSVWDFVLLTRESNLTLAVFAAPPTQKQLRKAAQRYYRERAQRHARMQSLGRIKRPSHLQTVANYLTGRDE